MSASTQDTLPAILAPMKTFKMDFYDKAEELIKAKNSDAADLPLRTLCDWTITPAYKEGDTLHDGEITLTNKENPEDTVSITFAYNSLKDVFDSMQLQRTYHYSQYDQFVDMARKYRIPIVSRDVIDENTLVVYIGLPNTPSRLSTEIDYPTALFFGVEHVDNLPIYPYVTFSKKEGESEDMLPVDANERYTRPTNVQDQSEGLHDKYIEVSRNDVVA